jgi:ParB family chromosome partitioning protein
MAKEVGEFKGLLVDPESVVVVTDPTHWLYDKRVTWPLKEATVLDFMTHGVMQTIMLTKEEDKFLVVSGRRRVLHAREANKRLIATGCQPIKLRAIFGRGEKKSLYGMLISENEHREGDGPIGRALKAQRLIDFGSTRDEVGIYFDVTPQTIGSWLKMLALPEKIQELVEMGELSVLAGVTLAEMDLPEDALMEEAQSIIDVRNEIGRRLTARQIRQKLNPDKPLAPSRRVVNRLIDFVKESDEAGRVPTVSSDFIKGILWRDGKITNAEAGLSDLLTTLAALPAKRKSPKAQAEPPLEAPADEA